MKPATAMINVISAGLYATIQDKGRFGMRHLGIPWAGALCPAWQELANALVGNHPDTPVIECFEGGLNLQAGEHDAFLAIVGKVSAVINSGDGVKKNISPNRAFTLKAGSSLVISSTGEARLAVVAIADICVARHLGSTSTYAKAGLGGIDGRSLTPGQIIPIDQQSSTVAPLHPIEKQCDLPEALLYENQTLRVIPGPQFDHFSADGIRTFLHSSYELGSEADRMGVRLQGPAIEHRDASAKDIVSDAIVPGSIQIPGAGLPIVLLNDAHTAGGYPKIATVISCDLPLLGLQRSGTNFTFELVTIDQAIAANAQHRDLIDSTMDSFVPCLMNDLDSQTLLNLNLIDGVYDGS